MAGYARCTHGRGFVGNFLEHFFALPICGAIAILMACTFQQEGNGPLDERVRREVKGEESFHSFTKENIMSRQSSVKSFELII